MATADHTLPIFWPKQSVKLRQTVSKDPELSLLWRDSSSCCVPSWNLFCLRISRKL